MTEMTNLDREAERILRANDRGGYTIPTHGLYPYQWNWDSAFAAWGFAEFDIPRAWQELHTLTSGQWPNGMIPHILFHKPDPGYFPGPDVWGTEGKGPIPSSGITQPPVAASFARRIWEKDRTQGTRHIRALVPKLMAWHRWFMNWRTEDGAVFVTHPWEAGRDNAPDWDRAMAAIDPVGVGEYARRDTAHVDPSMRPTKDDYDRYIWLVQRGKRLGWDDAAMATDAPFRVADPTMTFILLRACRDLKELAHALDEDTGEIGDWIATLEAGAQRLKNPELGVFDAIELNSRQRTRNLSSASFLNWYAGVEAPGMLDKLDEAFSTCAYPVPSHDARAPDFDPKRYWRGPTWAIMNALIGIGLEDMGHSDHARRLREATRKMIESGGFAEYFHPITGEAAGGGAFTWTAAVWLAWCRPAKEGN